MKLHSPIYKNSDHNIVVKLCPNILMVKKNGQREGMKKLGQESNIFISKINFMVGGTDDN